MIFKLGLLKGFFFFWDAPRLISGRGSKILWCLWMFHWNWWNGGFMLLLSLFQRCCRMLFWIFGRFSKSFENGETLIQLWLGVARGWKPLVVILWRFFHRWMANAWKILRPCWTIVMDGWNKNQVEPLPYFEIVSDDLGRLGMVKDSLGFLEVVKRLDESFWFGLG